MFTCINCNKEVSDSPIGTKQRNHCPFCLWSLHYDENRPGDRKSKCREKMKPVGLLFKDEGVDKYGKKKTGELVVVHRCQGCDKYTKNRIAGDDDPIRIIDLLNSSKTNSPWELLTKKDKKEINIQLFGK